MLRFFQKFSDVDAQQAGVGRHAARRYLWLSKKADGSADWEVCLTVQGRSWVVCVGGYPAVSTKQARAEATKWRGLARRGLDPATEQEAFRDAAARNLHQFYC